MGLMISFVLPMSRVPPNPLDYASGSVRSRFDPAVWPGVPVLILTLFGAGVLSVTTRHMVPGGPFVSIHADVIPFVACSIVFHLAWRALGPGGTGRRIAMLRIVLVSVAIICFIWWDVVTFWFRPYARGPLIGL